MTRATKNKMKMAVVGSIPQQMGLPISFTPLLVLSLRVRHGSREPLEQSDQLLWIHFLEERR
jgi:hypothetical protein